MRSSARRQMLDVLLAPAQPASLNCAEFLAWADVDTLAEWVDGEVIMASPESDSHQDLAGFLTAVLRVFVESRGLGWVRSAPFLAPLREIEAWPAEIANMRYDVDHI